MVSLITTAGHNISLPLMLLFDLSLKSGKYQSSFKKCIVIPLYKSGAI